MKKFKFCILAGLLALLSVSAFAEGRLPANIMKLAHIRMDFRGIMQSAWTRKG